MPHETQLQYSGRVIVGDDGNGVTAERFATTAGGDQVRYILIVANDVVLTGASRSLPSSLARLRSNPSRSRSTKTLSFRLRSSLIAIASRLP